MRWQSSVAANNTAATARWLPVRSPAATTPKNSNANERLKEKENSPARVDSRFPPSMEKLGSNKNGRVAAARQAGPGLRRPARRPNAQAHTGSSKLPMTVTSLNATS